MNRIRFAGRIDSIRQFSKHIRSTLKEQMEQKVQAEKAEIEARNRMTEMVIEQDRLYHEQERQRKMDRARALMQVTAKNKEVSRLQHEMFLALFFRSSFQLMENKWDHENWNRLHQWHVERAILADDPINWSKTMT